LTCRPFALSSALLTNFSPNKMRRLAKTEKQKSAAAKKNAPAHKTESGGWVLAGDIDGRARHREAKALPGHPSPRPLAAGDSIDAGDAIARGVFGVDIDGRMPFDTPLGQVTTRGENFRHVVENRRNKRERFANRIPATLDDPDEIWRAQYLHTDGRTEWRRHYIRAYDDKKNAFVVATETPDGGAFFNFIPQGGSSINKRRIGVLLYTRARGRRHGNRIKKRRGD